ncbi:MAG: IS630 family transposase [Alphaproteobacteria bacterium]
MLRARKHTQAEIAAVLGVSHGTVRGWSSQSRAGERRVLRQGKRGRPKGDGRALSATEERRIIAVVRDKLPQQLSLPFYLWSVGAVMTLIEKKCGKTLSESGGRKYLKAWGFTVPRPATRYTSRDDVVVQRWLSTEYPKIAAQAAKQRAEIHWLDETGVNNQAVYQRGYALKGRTPVAGKPAKRQKISMISTVTNKGTMRFRLYEGALAKKLLLSFLEKLLKESRRKLSVIMDNLPVHKGHDVRAWAAKNSARITLFYLPPYAPDLNPDEYLNNDLKQKVHQVSGLPHTKEALKSTVLGYMRHIQKSPAKVKSYSAAKETKYAA